MPLLHAAVRVGGAVEIECGGDRHLKVAVLDGAAQPLELADAGNGVVRLDGDALALPGLGLDAVRICGAAAFTQRVEAAGQLLASDEGQHGVDSVGREGARGGDDVVPLTVDRLVGAEASCEGDAVAS